MSAEGAERELGSVGPSGLKRYWASLSTPSRTWLLNTGPSGLKTACSELPLLTILLLTICPVLRRSQGRLSEASGP
jgi:hypothetical protein